MLYYAAVSQPPARPLGTEDIFEGLSACLNKTGLRASARRALAIPPDITRLHSRAGDITRALRSLLADKLTAILPALGTHTPMTPHEIHTMYPGLDHNLFREHHWKHDLHELGKIPANYIREISGNRLNYDWPVHINSMLVDGGFDLIFSIGQVVPHEIVGFANHNKNIFIGTGGADIIHRSHFLGAVCGMESIMGRIDTPVRRALNYASDHFADKLPPIIYVLTVLGPAERKNPDAGSNLHGRSDPDIGSDLHGRSDPVCLRGLFIGDGYECFERAAELSRQVNISTLPEPLERAVVYLDPRKYRSTWIGNKAIYRTRMAMRAGGELIIIAPGLRNFGEDRDIDALIRRFGYRGQDGILEALHQHEELRNNLSAAAHLIHGSSEGRFSITYAPGHLSRTEIESASYTFLDPAEAMTRFDPEHREQGRHYDRDGKEFFFIQDPALGLWTHEGQ